MSSTAQLSDLDEKKARRLAYDRDYYQRNKKQINAKRKGYLAEWSRNNRGKINNALFKRRYGITPEQRDALFATQDFKCAICGVGGDERWHTDHCHASGRVRGILCHHCNLMLGNARDNPATLSAAITYLEKSNYGDGEEAKAA